MKNKKAIIALLIVLAISITALVACKPTPLTAPVIKLDGNVVSWNKVENATSYDVTVGGGTPVNVTETSYTINETAVGSYDITVIAKSANSKFADSAASNKVTYVVQDKPVIPTYDELDLDTAEVKLTYYLDEGITELDLTGLVITAVFSDESSNRTVAVNDVTVGNYDLTTEGQKEITLSYTIDGVTQDATLFVTVKERGIEDVKDCAKTYVQYDQSGKYALDYTSVRNMKGEELVADGMVTLNQGPTLVNADGNFVLITVAYLVDSIEDFNAINDDLDGYYVLMSDIDFGGSWHVGAYIGATPLKKENDANVLDITGAGNEENGRKGVAFNGTLDGQGYALKNIKINAGTESYYLIDAYGLAIFGYVGEQGVLRNLTVRNMDIRGGKYVAFLASYNQGSIENVCVEADCHMYSSYRAGYAAAAYNNGKVNNVVCYVGNYDCSNAAWNTDMEISNDTSIGGEESGLNGSQANSYICNKTDLTAELGDGWKYFEGLGTVLANDDYIAITTTQREWAIGNRFYLDDIFVKGDNIAVAIYPSVDYIDELGWDAERQSHYLVMKADSYASVTVNTDLTVVLYTFVKVDGAPVWMQSTQIVVKVVAPVVVDHELVSTARLENIIEGTDIDLSSILIEETYSDGTTKIIHPIRLDGYDKNGAVNIKQDVKAYYGNGENDYVELGVYLKEKSVTGIAIDETSAYKTNYTAGEATELDLTGIKLVVSYNNATSEKVDVTAAMLSAYDLSTAGTKEITVTYSEKTCTLSITVVETGVTVQGIAITGTPAKATYKLNESVTLDDLSGVTMMATLSNGTETPVALKSDMLSYDFSSAGSTNITVTYEEQTATIAVTVVDYATALNVTPAETELRYNAETTLDLVANATYTLTMASGATQSAAASKVTASAYKAGHNEITYTYTDDYATVSATQDYDIWYEITGDAVAEWAKMQANLAGYYRLTKDLDFGDAKVTPMGQTPIKGGDETTCDVPDPTADSLAVKGIPFTGKFDGQGYTIKYVKIEGSSFTSDGFGLSLFGYVGDGAEVKNFSLSNVSIKSKNQTAFVATYNQGLIENILVNSNCTIMANWLTAGVVTYNRGGSVRNVVCYTATAVKEDQETTGALNVIYNNNGTAENCFAVSQEDFITASAVLGEVDGWTYIDGYGPCYGIFAVVTQMDTSVAQDGTFSFTLVTDKDYDILVWVWGVNEEYYPVKGENNVYTFNIKQDTGMTVGSAYTFGVRVTGFGYVTTQSVTITEKEGL